MERHHRLNAATPTQLSALWLACALAAGSYPTLAQQITVSPSQEISDQAAAILVTGTTPHARVTIRAELTDGAGHLWSSEADFIADAHGSVDAAQQAPVKGSYHIASATGLIWSMQPAERGAQIYVPPHGFGPQLIQFHLLQNGGEAASAQLVQLPIGPDVQQSRVDGVLHGVFFAPRGGGARPGILVVGGSEGGTPLAKAAWLASHGYAALALCYFNCAGTENMPRELENIPLEYFGQALAWMMQRPEVSADQLAVMGTSRGGELALQLGAIYPAIKAVVAYVPADFRHPACCERGFGAAWTLKGRPLSWGSSQGMRFARGADAEIAVENINGPVLMIGAQDDGVWPSARMVESAASRLRSRHFAHPVVVLLYAHAGHRAGSPAIEPTWAGTVIHPLSGRTTNFGGTPEGNAESTLDAIPKVLDFLQRYLGDAAAAASASPGSDHP